jgi:hypothetical protein
MPFVHQRRAAPLPHTRRTSRSSRYTGALLALGDDHHEFDRCLMPEDGNPLIVLVVPHGAEDAPISHGDKNWEPYRENGRWLVAVPRHVALPLCKTGGFWPLADG